MSSLRIRIGAVKDRSIDIVFSDMEKRSQRAAKNIERNMAGAMRTQSGVSDPRVNVRTTASDLRAQERLTQNTIKNNLAAEKFAHKQRMDMLKAERAMRSRSGGGYGGGGYGGGGSAYGDRWRMASRTAYQVSRSLPNVPGAYQVRGAGRDVLSGMGVNTQLLGVMEKAREAQDLAISLSNKGYTKGAAGIRGIRVAPEVLLKEAQDMVRQHGGSTSDVLRGMTKFTEVQGNLESARAIMPYLHKRAIANDANDEDMGTAAAKVDTALASQGVYQTDVSARNALTTRVIDQLAGQSKISSIDMDQISKHIGKISGTAAMFAGNVGDNIIDSMAIAQFAEQGPAANAATAATYTQSMILDIVKQSDEIDRYGGINVFKEGGKLMNPVQILTKLLENTENGKIVKMRGQPEGHLNQLQLMAAAFPNKRSWLATAEPANIFRGAGGGEAGTKAVLARFAEMRQADTSLEEDLAMKQQSATIQADKVNVELEDVAGNLQKQLLPVLKELTPTIVALAKSMSNMVKYVAEHPVKALFRALEVVILRAGMEAVLRRSIERAIMGGAANMPGSGGIVGGAAGGKGGGAAGGKGSAFLIGGDSASKAGKVFGALASAALILGAAEFGIAIGNVLAPVLLDAWADNDAKGLNTAVDAALLEDEKFRDIQKRSTTGLSQTDRATLEEEQEGLTGRIADAKSRLERSESSPMLSTYWDLGRAGYNAISGGLIGTSSEQIDKERVDAANLSGLEERQKEIAAMLSSELTVRISNVDEFKKSINAGVYQLPVPGYQIP